MNVTMSTPCHWVKLNLRLDSHQQMEHNGMDNDQNQQSQQTEQTIRTNRTDRQNKRNRQAEQLQPNNSWITQLVVLQNNHE